MIKIAIAPYESAIDKKLENILELSSPDNPYVKEWRAATRPWPDEPVAFILATNNGDKVEENKRPLAFYDLNFHTAKTFFGDTVPDSDEPESHSIHIARGKVTRTIIQPWEKLAHSRSYRQQALDTVGVASAQHVLCVAEDRSISMDPLLRTHPIFDDVRNNPDSEAKEAFDPGHPFPGKRFKELSSEMAGVPELIRRAKIAFNDLQSQGKDVSEEYCVDISYYLRPLQAGLLPIPAKGIVLQSRECGFIFRDVTNTDLSLMEEGHEFGANDFQVPVGYLGEMDDDGKQVTSKTLLKRNSNYYANISQQAQAITAFAAAVKIPELDKPRTYRLESIPEARLLTNKQIGHSPETPTSSKLANHPLSKYTSEINSLADIERSTYLSEGTVIFDPEKSKIKSPGQDLLTRDVEALLLFCQRAALKPHGGDQGSGRPLMVQEDFFRRLIPWYGRMVNAGTIGAKREEIFETFVKVQDLAETLRAGAWNMNNFKSNPRSDEELPEFNLMDQRGLCEALEIDSIGDLGFCVAGLGTASSKIASGLRDAEHATQLMAQDKMTIITGGGTREVMGRFFTGAIKSYQDGNRGFRKIGFRVPVVSRCEGSMEEFLKAQKLVPENGLPSDPYFSFLDSHCHVFEMNHMAERQHAIFAASHAGIYFVGGIGTVWELLSQAYHNLMVQERGYGIFPGFDINTRQKPLAIVNSEVVNGKTKPYFESFLSLFSEEDLNRMGIRVFDEVEPAHDYLRQVGRAFDFDLPRSSVARSTANQISREAISPSP